MKLGTLRIDAGTTSVGLVADGRAVDVGGALTKTGFPGTDLGTLLSEGPDRFSAAISMLERQSGDQPAKPLDEVEWDVPVPRPQKILCVAANYQAHIEETKVITYAPGDEACPWFFQKPVSSLNPHKAPIRLPELGEKIDWEAELCLVIGRRGKDINPDNVYDYIAGYTVFNDISARGMRITWRKSERDRDRFHDWLHGKWFDTFSCVGPWMTTLDELGPVDDFRVRLELNGETRQDASTDLMIFSVPTLVSFISSVVTLEPGDLIATGTPAGVGKASGRFLEPGDQVRASVEGVGELVNPVE